MNFSPVSVSALIEPDELQNSQIVRSSLPATNAHAFAQGNDG
jgi:hypothetical protein